MWFEIIISKIIKISAMVYGYDTWLSRKRPKFDSELRYSNLIFASF